MSGTRKDRPYWVKVNDPKTPRIANHDHESFGKVTRSFRRGIVKYSDECTIDKPLQHPSTDKKNVDTCSYDMDFSQYDRMYYQRMDRDDRLNTYYRPLRNAERRSLNNATKDYNTNGDIEDDVLFNERFIHGMYGGGYWD